MNTAIKANDHYVQCYEKNKYVDVEICMLLLASCPFEMGYNSLQCR